MRIIVSAFLTLAVLGEPAAARAPEASSVIPTSEQAVALRIGEALALAQQGRAREAFDILKATVTARDFAELPEDQRAIAHYLYGLVALDVDEPKIALDALREATAWKLSPADMWDSRLQAAASARDAADEAFTLTHIARVFPDLLRDTYDQYIFGLVRRSDTLDARGEAHFQLIDALYDAKWTPDNPFYDANSLRVPLARHLIERGNLHKAGEVLTGPLGARPMVSLRTERIFDVLVQPRLKDFDVLAAGEADLARTRKVAAEEPRNLEGVNAVAARLLELGRDEEALALLNDAIRRATPLVGKEPDFDDLDSLNWTYNYRAHALERLGRHEAAIEDLKRGARRPEQGKLNVSQAINLGQYLTQLGRPEDALDAVADVTRSDVSGYGWLSAQLVRVCAHTQLGETAKATAALDDIMANRKDGPIVAQEALFCAGDEARAAHLLVERLGDPAQRSAVLLELQDYLPDAHATDIQRQLEARMLAARARPEVQAAIAKVGRTEKHPLTSPRF